MSNDLIPSPDELKSYVTIAQNAAKSQFFNKLGGEAGILSIMLLSRELGLSPMTCIFGGMNCIQGKVELAPRLMNSMIRKAGHQIHIQESTDFICTMKGVRGGTGESHTCSYSIDDAKKASLIKSGSGWEKCPSDMLFARCLSRLARRLFPDVISSAYVEGEIGETSEKKPPIQSHVVEVTLTPAIEAVEEMPKEDPMISTQEAISISRDITLLIAPVDPEYEKRCLEAMRVESFEQIRVSQFEKVKKNIAKKIEMLKKQELNSSTGEVSDQEVQF